MAAAAGALIVVIAARKFQDIRIATSKNLHSPVSNELPLRNFEDSRTTSKNTFVASNEKSEKATAEKNTDEHISVDGSSQANTLAASLPKRLGGLVPYSTNRKVKPLRANNAFFMEAFPNVASTNSAEENFGVESNLIENVKDFLQKHICLNPKFSMITTDKRAQSKFFEVVKENSYRGITTLLSDPKSAPKKFETIVQFDSPLYENLDYIEIRDEKNVMEKRVIDSENSPAVWRFNSCVSSVVLLSDRCPWNDKYTYEFKDLFVSPDSKKLVGNIYCKGLSDTSWVQQGSLELNQAAE